MPIIGEQTDGGLFVKDYDDYRLIVTEIELTDPAPEFNGDTLIENYNVANNRVLNYNTGIFDDWDLPTVAEMQDIIIANVHPNGFSNQPLAPTNGNQFLYNLTPTQNFWKWYWTKSEGEFPSQIQVIAAKNHVQGPGGSITGWFSTATVLVSNPNAGIVGDDIYAHARGVRRIPIPTDDTQNVFQEDLGVSIRTNGPQDLPTTKYITTMVAGNKGSGSTQPQSIDFSNDIFDIKINTDHETLGFGGTMLNSSEWIVDPRETLPCNGSGSQICSLTARFRQMYAIKFVDNQRIYPIGPFQNHGDFYNTNAEVLLAATDSYTYAASLYSIFNDTPGPFRMSDFRGIGHWGIKTEITTYAPPEQNTNFSVADYESDHGYKVSSDTNEPLHLGGDPSPVLGDGVFEGDDIYESGSLPFQAVARTYELVDYLDPLQTTGSLHNNHLLNS